MLDWFFILWNILILIHYFRVCFHTFRFWMKVEFWHFFIFHNFSYSFQLLKLDCAKKTLKGLFLRTIILCDLWKPFFPSKHSIHSQKWPKSVVAKEWLEKKGEQIDDAKLHALAVSPATVNIVNKVDRLVVGRESEVLWPKYKPN